MANYKEIVELVRVEHFAIAIDDSRQREYRASQALFLAAIQAAYPAMNAAHLYDRWCDNNESIAYNVKCVLTNNLGNREARLVWAYADLFDQDLDQSPRGLAIKAAYNRLTDELPVWAGKEVAVAITTETVDVFGKQVTRAFAHKVGAIDPTTGEVYTLLPGHDEDPEALYRAETAYTL